MTFRMCGLKLSRSAFSVNLLPSQDKPLWQIIVFHKLSPTFNPVLFHFESKLTLKLLFQPHQRNYFLCQSTNLHLPDFNLNNTVSACVLGAISNSRSEWKPLITKCNFWRFCNNKTASTPHPSIYFISNKNLFSRLF